MSSTHDAKRELVETLRRELTSGDMTTYQRYYVEFKDEFFGFARRMTRDDQVIADSYHDAFIALYENIVQQKLQELSSSLKTYIFSIGKYALLSKLRKGQKEILEPEFGDIPEVLTETEDNAELIDLRKNLRLLGESCRKIILLFYYKRFSVDAIVEEMEYKNANTAKAHKSRCMKKLKELMTTKTNRNDDA